MPRRFSSEDVIRGLRRLGIHPARQKGSHIQLTGEHAGKRRTVTVRANQRVLQVGDLKSILHQAGITQAQLEALVDL